MCFWKFQTSEKMEACVIKCFLNDFLQTVEVFYVYYVKFGIDRK